MKTEIKNLDPAVNSFEANGKKYIVNGTIPLGRYPLFEKYQAALAWGVDFDQQYQDWGKVWDLMNKNRLAEASVMVNNIREGVSRKIEQREHPALMLCTLFIVREGEDLSQWNEAEALEKVADWKEEAISIESFFDFACSLVKGFREVLNKSLSDTFLRAGEPK